MNADDWLAIAVYSLATLGALAAGVAISILAIYRSERREIARTNIANKGEVNLQTEATTWQP